MRCLCALVALGLVGLPPTTVSAASSPSLFLDINATGVGSNPRGIAIGGRSTSPRRIPITAGNCGHQTDPPPARHW